MINNSWFREEQKKYNRATDEELNAFDQEEELLYIGFSWSEVNALRGSIRTRKIKNNFKNGKRNHPSRSTNYSKK